MRRWRSNLCFLTLLLLPCLPVLVVVLSRGDGQAPVPAASLPCDQAMLERAPLALPCHPLRGFGLSQAETSAWFDRVMGMVIAKGDIGSEIHALRLLSAPAAADASPGVGMFCRELHVKLTDDSLPGVDARDQRTLLDSPYGVVYRTLPLADAAHKTFSFADRAEPHVDKMLSIFAETTRPLDMPLVSSSGHRYMLRDLLVDSLMRCHHGRELEWSLVAYAHYLRSDARWTNAAQEQVDLDDLIGRVAAQKPGEGPCYGQHRLYAMAKVLQRAHAGSRLTGERTTELVRKALLTVAAQLERQQLLDGSWNAEWRSDSLEPSPSAPLRAQNALLERAEKFKVTAHVLEWCALVPPPYRPGDKHLRKACDFIHDELTGGAEYNFRVQFPATTHAIRALLNLRDPKLEASPRGETRDASRDACGNARNKEADL